MRKIISLLLVLVLALGLMAGCGSDKKTPSDSASVPGIVDDTVISSADVVFVDANGEAVYRIIRPEDGKFDETLKSGRVFKQYKTTFGVSPKNVSDKEDGTDVYEILIGNTNRPESQQAMTHLRATSGGRYNDYIICTIGKKIVINAYNSEALDTAVTYFIDNYLKADGIKGGIDYVYAVQGDFQNITVNGVNIGDFSIIRPNYNSSYLTQVEMDKLVDTVYTKTGYKLSIGEDDYVVEGTYEIVVGNTNRDGVKTIENYDEYDITVKGNKVYLNGGSPHATAMAVSEFAKVLSAGAVTDASSVNGSYETAMANYDRKTTYYPTWYDTFDGDVIDPTKWHIMNDPEFSRAGQNGKWSAMSNDPNYIFQTGGKFYVYGREEDNAYYGGTISNSGKLSYHYGYVEKSAICPDGPGFWSLLWFSGTSDGTNILGSPEIDLNECFGNGRATQANCHGWPNSTGTSLGYEHTSLDGPVYGNDKRVECPDNKTFADDFHTYGFLWDEDEMTFMLDGEIWFSYQTNTTEWDIDVFVNSWMYMKLSFSVGRENNNLLVNNLTPEQWANSSVFIVDWIYLYQFDDGVQGLILR